MRLFDVWWGGRFGKGGVSSLSLVGPFALGMPRACAAGGGKVAKSYPNLTTVCVVFAAFWCHFYEVHALLFILRTKERILR